MEYCKLQIGCLLVLLYITIIYYKEKKRFHFRGRFSQYDALLLIGFVNLMLDGITAYTVNHLDTVNGVINMNLHGLFLISIDMLIFALFLYMLSATEGLPADKRRRFLLYVLSGLVVCGDCGAPMIKRDVPAGGKVYSYYICSRNNATKECGTHRIPREKLESLVLQILQVHIANILDMKRILEYVNVVPFQELDIKELENRRDVKEQEILRCKEMRNLLYEDLKDGIVCHVQQRFIHEGKNSNEHQGSQRGICIRICSVWLP